ncbi:hypothetical protein DFH07DRAFT_757234 [Mycena maculata]|uniref:Uncharacterized protein n=1 Tax=Mycena maculata TaxID=230809 RepID=A0AAD7HW24_9AGAR|nr:hypothetical protein DFH07DRAFT_757234 [Mycena maculata]
MISKACFTPHRRLPSKTQCLDKYLQSELARCRGPPNREKPWEPFRTQLDFEVSEFAQENMLNRKATDKLISLIRRCAVNLDNFTIQNYSDMNKQWEGASKKCTKFQRYDVAVKYKGVDQIFEMHAQPLWDWTLDLIQDPRLASFFIWDAQRNYKYNGVRFIHFYTEPWTADTYWETQVYNPDAKLCPYIIYVDKSKLSSFGTEKVYPIIARLANIVVGIRNGNEWGGGQVVGSLPVVKDDTAESSKPGYVDFTNTTDTSISASPYVGQIHMGSR